MFEKANVFSLIYYILIVLTLCYGGFEKFKYIKTICTFYALILSIQYALYLVFSDYETFPLKPSKYKTVEYSLLNAWTHIPDDYKDLAHFFGFIRNAKSNLPNLWYDFIVLILLVFYIHIFCDALYQKHHTIDFFADEKDPRMLKIRKTKTRSKFREQFRNVGAFQKSFQVLDGQQSDNQNINPDGFFNNIFGKYAGVERNESMQIYPNHFDDDQQIYPRKRGFFSKGSNTSFLGPALSHSCSKEQLEPTNHLSNNNEYQQNRPAIQWGYQLLKKGIFQISSFTIAITVLCISLFDNSFISIPYIIFSMLIIFKSKSYYSSKWRLDYSLTFFMLPYCLADILLQLIYQLPIDQFSSKYDWGDITGVYKLSNGKSSLIAKSFIFILLTCENWVEQQPSYKKYRKEFLENYQLSAEYRSAGFTYIFNNKRLKQIQKHNQQKLQINQNLHKLWTKIKKWNSKFHLFQFKSKKNLDQNKQLKLSFNSESEIEQASKFNRMNSSQYRKNEMKRKGSTAFKLESKRLLKAKIGDDQVSDFSDKLSLPAAKSQSLNYFQQDKQQQNPFQPRKKQKTAKKVKNQDLKKSFMLQFYLFVFHRLQSNLIFQSLYQLDKQVEHLAKGNAKLRNGTQTLYQKANFQYKRRKNINKLNEKIKRQETTTNLLKRNKTQIQKQILRSQTTNKNLDFSQNNKIKQQQTLSKQNSLTNLLKSNSKKNFQSSPQIQQTPNLKKFRQQTRCKFLCSQLLKMIPKILISNSQFICYFFMLLNHIINPTLLTLIYPISIFCYALIQNNRPSPIYWKIIIGYSSIVVFLKFVIRLHIWRQFYNIDNNHFLWMLYAPSNIGLRLYNQYDSSGFLNYIIWDNIVILTVSLHYHILISCGLDKSRQITMQTLKGAIKRIQNFGGDMRNFIGETFHVKDQTWQLDRELNNDTIQQMSFEQPSMMMIEGGSILQPFLTREELAPLIQTRIARSDDLYFQNYHNNLRDDGSFGQDFEQFGFFPQTYESSTRRRCLSHNDIDALRYAENEIDQLVKENNKKKGKSFLTKSKKKLKSMISNSKYLNRVFPKVKQEKPGYDLYVYKIFMQIIIVIWVFLLFPYMQGSYVQGSGVIDYSSFSGNMVIALIIEIIFMIVDRYLYISQTFMTLNDEKDKEKIKKSKLSVVINTPQTATFQSPSLEQSKKLDFFLNTQQQSEYKHSTLFTKHQQYKDQAFDQNTPAQVSNVKLHNIKQSQLKQFLIIIYLYINVLLIQYLIMWFFPLYGNNLALGKSDCSSTKDQEVELCNNLTNNWAAIVFVVMFYIYFYLYSTQIRKGIPQIRQGIDIQRSDNQIKSYVFKGYLKIPFVWEIKVLIDWTFSKTSLDIFQWFRFENIFAKAYIAKWNMRKYWDRKVGTPQQICYKFWVGFCLLLGLFVLIIIPLLLFSTLFDFNTVPAVTNANILIFSEFKEGNISNSIPLFKTQFAADIQKITNQLYKAKNFGSARTLNQFDQDLIQVIKLQKSSSSLFLPTGKQENYLKEKLKADQICNPTVGMEKRHLDILMRYEFNQEGSQGGSSQNIFQFNVSNSQQCLDIVNQFNETIQLSTCSEKKCLPINILQFYTQTIRLRDKGKVLPIKDPDYGADYEGNIMIKIICENDEKYWETISFTRDEKKQCLEHHQQSDDPGVVFYIFRDRVSGTFAGITAIGFYATIVFAVGNLLRTVFGRNFIQVILILGGVIEVIYTDQYKPQDVLKLCESITISRIQKNLVRQEQLYRILIDLNRSPQVLKMVTKPQQEIKFKED